MPRTSAVWRWIWNLPSHSCGGWSPWPWPHEFMFDWMLSGLWIWSFFIHFKKLSCSLWTFGLRINPSRRAPPPYPQADLLKTFQRRLLDLNLDPLWLFPIAGALRFATKEQEEMRMPTTSSLMGCASSTAAVVRSSAPFCKYLKLTYMR